MLILDISRGISILELTSRFEYDDYRQYASESIDSIYHFNRQFFPLATDPLGGK